MTQPWIATRGFDLAFILAPGLLVTLLALLAPSFFSSHAVSPMIWALLVIGVDVGHVYSTLYRTYFDRAEFARRKSLYILAPLLGWLAFAGIYSLGAMLFWRALAYLAVFHFVRQQYGFMMLYSRGERRALIDKAAIYAATLYPLIYWHTHPRQFSWFIDGDFVVVARPLVADLALAAYAVVIVLYAGKEWRLWRSERFFNWPRNLLLGVTALSWWGGIVALDSDLAFTMINVVAHGAPYVALIWWTARQQSTKNGEQRRLWPQLFTASWLPVFVAVPILFAYAEEGLWDRLVWLDHPGLFHVFDFLPALEENDPLVWLVPLLALPQITHYILDAFIWRRGRSGLGPFPVHRQELSFVDPRAPLRAG